MLELSKIVKLLTNPAFLSILALVILSIFALKSLAQPGFYTSHDGETHTARIAQYFIALSDGQIPPRHAASLYSGLGSPIFVYIYPLPYLLGSFAHLLKFSFTDSFKIITAISFLGSAIFAYLWLKEAFKSEKAGFLGALFYAWVPYRFSLIYVRASISELLAYTFVPLIFFSLHKLLDKKNIFWLAAAALSVSFLLLSQNLVAVFTLPVIIGYITVLSVLNKSLRYFIFGVLSLVWGSVIASITYIPSLFERNFIMFDEIIAVAYQDHFVTLKQLIRSPWDYGFDLAGAVNDKMSFQIGLAHLLVYIMSALVIIFLFLNRFRAVSILRIRFTDKIPVQILILTIFFLAVFLVSVFLMLDITKTRFIWDNFKILHTIDIPWRLLGVSAVATAFLAAFVAKATKSGLLFIFLILAVLIANRNHLRINKQAFFSDDFFLNYSSSATQYGEFTPKLRQTTGVPIDISPNIKTGAISGEVNFSNITASSKETSFELDILSPAAQVRINKFYFPEMEVKVDGKKLTPADSFGMPLVTLPKGYHRVVATYQETRLRMFANLLSLISFLAALIILFRYAKK